MDRTPIYECTQKHNINKNNRNNNNKTHGKHSITDSGMKAVRQNMKKIAKEKKRQKLLFPRRFPSLYLIAVPILWFSFLSSSLLIRSLIYYFSDYYCCCFAHYSCYYEIHRLIKKKKNSLLSPLWSGCRFYFCAMRYMCVNFFYSTELILCYKRSRGYLCWRHREQATDSANGSVAAPTFNDHRICSGAFIISSHSAYVCANVRVRERALLHIVSLTQDILFDFSRLKPTELYFHYDLNRNCWHASLQKCTS